MKSVLCSKSTRGEASYTSLNFKHKTMKHKHTTEEIASAKKNAKLTLLILALVIIACTADNWFNF